MDTPCKAVYVGELMSEMSRPAPKWHVINTELVSSPASTSKSFNDVKFKYATGRVVQSSAAPRRKVGHLVLQYQGMALHFR